MSRNRVGQLRLCQMAAPEAIGTVELRRLASIHSANARSARSIRAHDRASVETCGRETAPNISGRSIRCRRQGITASTGVPSLPAIGREVNSSRPYPPDGGIASRCQPA